LLLLRDMWRRRVRVTAGARRADQGTWSLLQAVAEMAAPYELRTPMGTCGESCNPSADGSMATVALESMSGRGQRVADGGERAGGAHEALPHTPPGGKPPETPAPFPWKLDYTEVGESVKGSLRRQKAPPLTDSPTSQTLYWDEGKGASGGRGIILPPVGRPRGSYPIRKAIRMTDGSNNPQSAMNSLRQQGRKH
jgi:hypothetical protein